MRHISLLFTFYFLLLLYFENRSPHGDQPSLHVSKNQAIVWMAESGFKPVEDLTLFPEKWFVVFARKP